MDNEYLSNKFYEHMKGKCSYTTHSGIAIYFCISKTCDNRYLCSECIIESLEHFTNHVKSLLPLDNKSKFIKFLNLTPGGIIPDNQVINTKDKIAEFYAQIKQKVSEAIDKHIAENIDKLCKGNNFNPKEFCDKTYLEVNKEIENFINKNDKSQFCQLFEDVSKKLTNLTENIADAQRQNFNVKISPEIINSKISEIFNEHLGITPLVVLNKTNSRNDKLFTFSEEYDGDSRLNQTAQFEDISNFSKSMGFNRDFQTFGKREEILNTLNSEVNEEESYRRNNIKSRLNDLKNKLANMK
jgi:hypothetical protein